MSSIYLSSRQRPYSIKPGQAFDDSIDFAPNTLIVDNYTTQYVFVPAVKKFVLPQLVGVTIPWPLSNTSVGGQFQAPPGLLQPPLGNPSTPANFIFYEDSHPANPGVSIVSNNTGTIGIGNITTNGLGDTVTKTFALTPGTVAVGYSVNFGLFGNPAHIKIVGAQSGRVYIDETGSGGGIGGPPFDFEVELIIGIDSSVICSVTSNNQSDSVDFIGYTGIPPFTNSNYSNSTNRSWDWTVTGNFQANSTPSLSITPPSGRVVVIGGYSCHLGDSAINTYFQSLIFRDTTVGIDLWRANITLSGASSFSKDQASLGGIAIRRGSGFGVGSTVTMSLALLPTAVAVDMSFGGWFALPIL